MRDLEADQFVCTRCGGVGYEHDLDGMGECRECAERMMAASDYGQSARQSKPFAGQNNGSQEAGS